MLIVLLAVLLAGEGRFLIMPLQGAMGSVVNTNAWEGAEGMGKYNTMVKAHTDSIPTIFLTINPLTGTRRSIMNTPLKRPLMSPPQGRFKKPTQVNIRMEKDLKETLELLAIKEGRSLSNLISRLLKGAVGEEDING